MSQLCSAFIFSPSRISTAQRIAHMVNYDIFSSPKACVIYTNATKMRNKLVLNPRQHCLAILLAANPQELRLMVALAPWLEGIKRAVMVPDQRRSNIALAHRLRPSYLMWPGIDYRELRVVLHNILTRNICIHDPAPPHPAPVLFAGIQSKQYFLLHRRSNRNGQKTSTDSVL